MKSIYVSTTRVICGAVLAAAIIMACGGKESSSSSVGAFSSSSSLPDIFKNGAQVKVEDGRPEGEVLGLQGDWVKIKTSKDEILWVNTNNPLWSWVEVEE